jgi:glutathione S-transferase
MDCETRPAAALRDGRSDLLGVRDDETLLVPADKGVTGRLASGGGGRVEYERVFVDIRDAASRANADFLAASPMGKVPALRDGDLALAESAAIRLYVADKYPGARLAPAVDDPQRGLFLYWMFFAPGVMEPAMAERVGGWEPNRGAGETFSAADIMVGSTAAFMRMFDMLPGSETIGSYVDRCLARPAYRKAMAMERGD